MGGVSRPELRGVGAALAGLFFVSGFPALLYQIVWQRALFTLYGVNIESVTVVVAAFMAGLGLGSLAGGWLSQRTKVPVLLLFAAIEFLIAAYGMASLPLFSWAGSFTFQVSSYQLGFVTFLLVLLPTMLMGATLPLLTHYLVSVSGSVGRSVGVLYFANTLGSATACFVAVKLTLPVFAMSGTVLLAAVINGLVGLSALIVGHRLRRSRLVHPSEPHFPAYQLAAIAPQLHAWAGVVLAAGTGFIALSYEIVWYRLYSFALGGGAKVFPYLLGFYLLGIALGSIGVRHLCDRGGATTRSHLTLWFFISFANIAAFLVAPILLCGADLHLSRWSMPCIVLPAALLGATFPLVCHLSVPPNRNAGRLVSLLYCANIIGSTAGTFLTGFLLMDSLPLADLLTGLSLFGLAVGLMVVAQGHSAWKRSMPQIALTLIAMAVIKWLGSGSLDRLYERLQPDNAGVATTERFADVIETRSGVITVDTSGKVYGGGVYDGAFNVDPKNDINGIVRAYALSALHPAPRRVLEIGLSSGSWAQVIANNPQVERLTSIEINPGYRELIRHHPEVASLLQNPKVSIHIDDGRRWLVQHPAEKFDFIVMNTIYNWRSGASNMLSLDFLELVRRHLAAGGVAYYNPTGSQEVVATGLRAFPYALTVNGFLAVSDSPLAFDRQRLADTLADYRIDGRYIFDLSDPERRNKLNQIVIDTHIETRATLLERSRNHFIITDDNMGVEFRSARR